MAWKDLEEKDFIWEYIKGEREIKEFISNGYKFEFFPSELNDDERIIRITKLEDENNR